MVTEVTAAGPTFADLALNEFRIWQIVFAVATAMAAIWAGIAAIGSRRGLGISFFVLAVIGPVAIMNIDLFWHTADNQIHQDYKPATSNPFGGRH